MTEAVNTTTGEIVEHMDVDAARRLTERIRLAATNYTDAKAKVLALVDEAKAGNAHLALGYKSWTAYLSDVLSDEPLRLARDDRAELSRDLADRGMSTRAIAPIVGADHVTVSRDIAKSTVAKATVDPSPTTRTTEGRDGKTRTYASAGRFNPRPPAETSLNLIESLADKAARETEKLTTDQIRRVKPNAAEWIDGIRKSVETLQGLLAALEHKD